MHDHDEAIQAGKPLPPWELPGFFRLDCEPHRGLLLKWLGFGSLLATATTLVPFLSPILLVAFPLSLTTSLMSKADLAKMQKGLMDPEGRKLTLRARLNGQTGMAICLVSFLIYGPIVVCFLLAELTR